MLSNLYNTEGNLHLATSSKTHIKVIHGKVVLRMCYGCGMDISARLVRDFSLLRTVWKDVFF